MEAATASAIDPSLFSGLAGLGWATDHLREHLTETDADEICGEVDAVLGELLLPSPWSGDYDLICGLVGFGVYALERLPRPGAVEILERVIHHLGEMVEDRCDGLTCWVYPNWLVPEKRDYYPRGYYNLGVAHGVPGVIALLGQACAAGVAIEKARPLLDGAVRWLLAQQPPDNSPFPHWLDPTSDVPPTPARLAWCYGDLGIAASLLLAAGCVGESAWEREAIAIARRSAARPLTESGVHDAGLCHGAAGLAHLFNRMYQATRDESLGDGARYWFRHTLELRQLDRGIAGYSAHQPGRAPDDCWVDSPDLLGGAAGVALALLAATTAIEPNWDRVLMTAIPPQC